jgi:hypothetical protein
MSGAADPYIRIYFRVRDDARFEHAYGCDICWAAYTRLLMDAEAAFPVPASLPTLRPHAKTELLAAGIIELRMHGCFVIHGLEAERERRSHQGKAGAAARWQSERNANASPTHSERNANAMRQHPAPGSDALLTDQSKAESISSTPSVRTTPTHARPQLDDADPAFALRQWLASHNAPIKDGDGYHAKLVRLIASDSGKTCSDVIAVFERLAAGGARTSKQYVMGAEDALFPVPKTTSGKTARSLSDTDFDAGMVGAEGGADSWT